MLLDNENKNPKVYEWIEKYTKEGKFEVVTGYFTIGAINFISKILNKKIDKFSFILGDIVKNDDQKEFGIDLLNENLSVDGAFKLSEIAKNAVSFLEQEYVDIKTLEPNFCHAKAYIFNEKNDEKKDSYFITGSSNLTEAGIGLKTNNNAELNIADTAISAQFGEIDKWFKSIWDSKKAKSDITIINPRTEKKEKKNFKKYLIEEIKKVFKKYTPEEIYYKVLFELFGTEILVEQEDVDFNRYLGKLQNTKVYKTLYPFQKRGVHALIKMLKNYNGAILADAVGLGKTWSALAVIKYFEMRGYSPVILCPKKIQQNWEKFLEEGNLFSKDNFDYKIRFHTDLQDDRWNRYTGKEKYDIEDFTNDKPKLLVIDESHNLRNDKSNRYQFLVKELLQKVKGEVKILMLSATPINNTLLDIRNQFRLITLGNDLGFYESIGIKNLDYVFRRAQRKFNEWRQFNEPKIGDFIKMLPSDIFRLTDSLIVARTRRMIKGMENDLEFPKVQKPENIYKTPLEIGNIESFDELFNHFPPMLSGYQPTAFLDKNKDFEQSVLQDERQRDFFLVKMMYILMVKRLESSWFSFFETVKRILEHHQNALNRIKDYQKSKKEINLQENSDELVEEDDEINQQLDQFTLGKKRKTKLSDIDKAGNLKGYKKKLKDDINSLQLLVTNLEKFCKKIDNEVKISENKNSVDNKLQALIEKINQKKNWKPNNNNNKIIIFTAYKDTGEYLFEQLKKRGYDKLAFVSGDYSRSSYSEHKTKKYEPILQQFAPYTKLFKEKEWSFTPSKMFMSELEEYNEWKIWVQKNHNKTHEILQKPVDILIATDALSEGQNLQDSDMVINYDIHWNPVRIIQRMGRIDRLGTLNKKVYGVNFWPSDNINKYLDLQGRIEKRMAAMTLAGAEVQYEFSDSFNEMARNEELERKQKECMLRQMETSLEDIEEEVESLGMDDLSLEKYRQLLYEELEKSKEKYMNMPKGVYTGFIDGEANLNKKGLIALLGYPSRKSNVKTHNYKEFDLIYIDEKGNNVLMNQKEILEGLTENKDKVRYVPDNIDKGNPEELKKLSKAIDSWMQNQAIEQKELDDGTKEKRMGKETKDILQKLKTGDKEAVERVKENMKVSDKYKANNFDLIAWYVIN